MSNYASMAKRIRASKTKEGVRKEELSLDGLYNAGIFTANEFNRLDSLIVDQYIKLEE